MEIFPKSWLSSEHYSDMTLYLKLTPSIFSLVLTLRRQNWKKVSSSLFLVTLIQELFLLSSYLSEHGMMPLLSISVWFSKSCCQSCSSKKWKAHGNWCSHSQFSNLIELTQTPSELLLAQIYKRIWWEKARKFVKRGKIPFECCWTRRLWLYGSLSLTMSCVFVSTEHISLQTIWASEMKVSWN